MTFFRSAGGRPAASAPMTIALSPASTRSIMTTVPSACQAPGSVMKEKSIAAP